MLFAHSDALFKCILVVFAIMLFCLITAYSVNHRRAPDDQKKQSYHPYLIILALFIIPLFPIFLLLGIFVYILRALLFAGFLILFAVLLIIVRKPFIIDWWNKFATTIGDPLLKVTNFLVGLAFRPLRPKSQAG